MLTVQSRALLKDRVDQAARDSAARMAAEEKAARLERELATAKKALETQAKAPVVAAGDPTLKQYTEDLTVRSASRRPALTVVQKMLKCSACQTRFKAKVITRCYHLFCGECIDARISNRQRKCPTCALPFGAADVQQIYFVRCSASLSRAD